MKFKPIIVFDIDGVLADFVYAFTGLHKKLYGGKQYSNGAQTSWRFEDTGYKTEEVDAVWEHIKNNPNFWGNAPTLLTKQELWELADLEGDARVVYLTNRYSTAYDVTKGWLAQYGLIGELHMVAKKAEWCAPRIEGILGVIEDKPRNIIELSDAGLPVYRRDWPYNRNAGIDIPDVRGVPAVSSVSEFIHIMRGKM